MKNILLALTLAATVARAETIALQPADCGTLKQCIGIPNDSPLKVDIYGAPQYPFFYVYLTDSSSGLPVTTTYIAGVPSSTTGDVQLQSFYWVNFGLPGNYKVFTGQTITLNGSFTSVTKKGGGSGRGGGASHTFWTFAGGTLVVP